MPDQPIEFPNCKAEVQFIEQLRHQHRNTCGPSYSVTVTSA